MPNGSILVWDNANNTPRSVPLAEYQAGVDDGRWSPYDQSVVQTDRLGGTATLSPESALVSGEAVRDVAARGRADAAAQRRELFDTLGDKALTFAEGVVDAASLGLIHEHGEAADIRRDVNSGSAFGGQLVGLVGTLAAGPETLVGKLAPAARVGRGAADVGKAAATAVLGAAEKGTLKAVAARGIEEATINGALSGAAAFGHGVSDAVFDNKDFAGEQVVAEAGHGALLGGGIGVVAGLFGRAAMRAKAREVAGQGGLLDPTSVDSKAISQAARDAHAGLDDVVANHQARMGALDTLHANGELGDFGGEFLAPRKAALKAAEKAQARLGEVDVEAALGGDAKALDSYLQRLDDYQAAARKLDEVMTSTAGDRASLKRGEGAKTNPNMKAAKGAEPAAPARSGGYTGRFDTSDVVPEGAVVDRQGGKIVDRRNGFDLSDVEVQPLDPNAGSYVPGPRYPAAPEGYGPSRVPPTGGPVGLNPWNRGPRTLVDAAAPEMEAAATARRTPLQAFAHDVEHTAAGLGENPALKDIWAAMKANGGKPGTFERFHQLVAEAMDAGELSIIPKDGGSLLERNPAFAREAGAAQPPWGFRDRFPNGAGARAPRVAGPGDTLPGGMGPDLQAFVKQPTLRLDMSKTQPDMLAGALAKQDFLAGQQAAKAAAKEAQKAAAKAEAEAAKASAAQKAAKEAEAKAAQKAAKEAERAAARAEKEAERLAKEEARRFGSAKTERMEVPDVGIEDGTPGPQPVTPPPAGARTPASSGGVVRRGVKPFGKIDDFLAEMEAMGPRISPADRAAAKLQAMVDSLKDLKGGQLGHVEARAAAKAAGLPQRARSAMSDQLAALWGARQLGRAVEEAAAVGAVGAVGGERNLTGKVLKASARAAGRNAVYGGKLGKAAGAAAVGVIGGHVAGVMMGAMAFSGSVASSVGRARNAVLKAADTLLSSEVGRAAVRAVPLVAKYSYDGSPPTEDVHTRVVQLQSALANPEMIRSRVLQAMGDAAVIHPQLGDAVVATTIRHYQNLAVRAPAFMWSALGEPRVMGQQNLRRFREYEDATANPDAVVEAIGRGAASQTQVDALRDQYPERHAALVSAVLADPERLKTLPRDKLAAIQKLTGLPLTHTDPAYIAAQQAMYAPKQQPGDPSALKSPGPTPAQSPAAPPPH